MPRLAPEILLPEVEPVDLLRNDERYRERLEMRVSVGREDRLHPAPPPRGALDLGLVGPVAAVDADRSTLWTQDAEQALEELGMREPETGNGLSRGHRQDGQDRGDPLADLQMGGASVEIPAVGGRWRRWLASV